MNTEALWELFLDTGSPEVFLLYRGSCREKRDVTMDKQNLSFLHSGDPIDCEIVGS